MTKALDAAAATVNNSWPLVDCAAFVGGGGGGVAKT